MQRIILAAAFAIAGAASLSCDSRLRAEPIEWRILEGGNGHFYELVPQALTWPEAKQAAEAMTFMEMPGHLATITSEEENAFLLENLFDPPSGAWIGLTDNEAYGGSESFGQPDPTIDGWKWVTGEPVEYTNWWHAEPNNLNDEDFTVMGGTWNDGKGEWTYPYIVEYGDAIVRDAHLFYNNSAFDDNGPAVDEHDFAAIAADKAPLRSGEDASFANISGYSRGINGIFIDIDGLPADDVNLDAGDFSLAIGNGSADSWVEPEMPANIGVLRDQGEDGSDRVYLTFADGAITNAWLRVTVKANSDTNLPADHEFFFGTAPGETGASFVPFAVGADAADLQSIATHLTPLSQSGTELVSEPNDVNRDGTIDAFDLQIVAVNLNTHVLNLMTPQLDTSIAPAAVPEPGSMVMLALAIFAVLAIRR